MDPTSAIEPSASASETTSARSLSSADAVAHAGGGPRRQGLRPIEHAGVNLAAYFASETGVGQGVRGMASALNAAGVAHVSNLFATNDASRQNDASVRDFAHENPFPVNLIHVNADQVPVFARTVGDAYSADRYNIGCWNWELDRLPEEWHDRFGYCDEVWAPSNFCLDAYAAASPVPVVRVPLAVDVPAVSRSRSKSGLDERAFIFLFSFDFRSVFERKNPLATIEAFKNAFRGDDRAQLVVNPTNEDADATDWRRVQQAAGSAGIRLMPGYIGRDEVYELMASADGYVYREVVAEIRRAGTSMRGEPG